MSFGSGNNATYIRTSFFSSSGIVMLLCDRDMLNILNKRIVLIIVNWNTSLFVFKKYVIYPSRISRKGFSQHIGI